MGAFNALRGRSSDVGRKPYALRSYFQLYDSGSGKKGARGEHSAIQIDEDASGEAQGEAGKLEVWSLPGAIEYHGGIDHRSNMSGGTVYPEVVDT